MNLVQELSLRQYLGVTQQLILTMKLLQVSALDLEQMVRQELEENPALEQADEQSEPGEATAGEFAMPPEPGPTAPAEAEPSEPEGQGNFEVRPGEEYSLAELLPEDAGTMPVTRGATEERESAIELSAGPETSLHDTLMPRLRASLNEADATLAEFIIDSIDEDGFLTMSEEEIAESQGTDVERVRSVLYVVQRLEPGGIGCRDARESFLVQLELAGFDPASLECKLLRDHWGLLMKKQTAKVAKLCGVTEDEVRQAIQTILRLEPRPARQFDNGMPGYVAPDFSIEWQEDKLVAVANDENFPRLRLARRYQEILRNPKSYPREQVKFAREKFQRALMFLRGIESRRRTLQKLVEVVIEQQRGFFLHGREHLKPATLRQAADRIGVHASTISRAIAGKYVETTYGIFPLGYFFKAGTKDKSRTSIKGRVQAIIEAEDKSCPLNDDEICRRLKDEGIDISRRTVAKYRGELNIPGAVERKGF
jgi:RNA polymerase sigma-54 factor